jgi:hypothetical protein
MDFRETGRKSKDWINLAQYMDWWQVLVDMVINFEIPNGRENIEVFWLVMLCELLGRYQCFGRKYCLHLQG